MIMKNKIRLKKKKNVAHQFKHHNIIKIEMVRSVIILESEKGLNAFIDNLISE
jgi:hypothetical protein